MTLFSLSIVNYTCVVSCCATRLQLSCHTELIFMSLPQNELLGIKMDKLPRDMSLAELAERCGVEMRKYSRKEACDDQYCLEVFRRAMLQNNERAWEILHQCFNGVLLNWVRCHPHRDAAYRCD